MKKILLFLFVLAVGGLAYGVYLYNKPHKNMQHQDVDFKMDASSFFANFEENEEEANDKYLDKVVEVNGSIRNIVKEDGKVSIILNTDNLLGGVTCELDDFSEHSYTNLQEGTQITIRGICTGMLMDVVLVRCIIISKSLK